MNEKDQNIGKYLSIFSHFIFLSQGSITIILKKKTCKLMKLDEDLMVQRYILSIEYLFVPYHKILHKQSIKCKKLFFTNLESKNLASELKFAFD